MGNLLVVSTYFHKYEADIAKGMLESYGIKSTISSDDLAGYREHLTIGIGNIKLLVEESDLEEAKLLLEDVSRAEDKKEEKTESFSKTPMRFWETYFWVAGLFSIGFVFLVLFLPQFSMLRFVALLFSLIPFVALYGYVHRKKIFSFIFWRICFWAYVLYQVDTYSTTFLEIQQAGGLFKPINLFLIVWNTIFIAPLFIALYIYPSRILKEKV